MSDTYWRDTVAYEFRNCIGVDTNVFFPGPYESNEKAKAICKGCPVMEACRDEGMYWHEHGIWGGASESARKLRRGRMRSDGALRAPRRKRVDPFQNR